MFSFTEIPFTFDMKQLFENLRIKPGTDRAKGFGDLVNVVRKIGKPKALVSSRKLSLSKSSFQQRTMGISLRTVIYA